MSPDNPQIPGVGSLPPNEISGPPEGFHGAAYSRDRLGALGAGALHPDMPSPYRVTANRIGDRISREFGWSDAPGFWEAREQSLIDANKGKNYGKPLAAGYGRDS